MFYNKWWKRGAGWPDTGNCLKKEFSMKEKAAVNALGVVNIGGVFVVLLVGLAFAVTVAIGEFCWKTSSLNSMKSENIIQTSPLRRNSRKFTSIERRRSRKSLCAEIARTLMPRLICDSYGSSTPEAAPHQHHHHEAAAAAASKRDQETLDDISEIYHYMPAATGNFPRYTQ